MPFNGNAVGCVRGVAWGFAPILTAVLRWLEVDFAVCAGFNGGLAVGQPFGGPNGEVFAVDFRVVSDVDWERRAD